MHELGVVIDVVTTVEEFMKANSLTSVESLVLQIGELSSMIPKYIEDVFPCAVEGTMLERTSLKIEVLPGMALCKECGDIHRLIENQAGCPKCASSHRDVLGGREFTIKEIVAC